MKHLLKLLLFLFIPILVHSQNKDIVSSFERDGRLWVSYESKQAQTQYFHPLDSIYKCDGMFMQFITDTVSIKGFYKITLGNKWIKVKDLSTIDPLGGKIKFSWHIMFQVMACCFDKQFVYCQCGQKFPIIGKNF